ncbi:putative duf500 domain-containing protein [Rosellinia necatrix]|uniref:Putative duf500 domain-containing protein n=1 Tax=Rosellinia necatrix TaxID=77044 RepID=A0A1W2TVW7_ROSNE|nr:putative duf500 domain-containing protein [Rosellinia necatrix]
MGTNSGHDGPPGYSSEHPSGPAELYGSDAPVELAGDTPQSQSKSHPVSAGVSVVSPQRDRPSVVGQDYFPPPPPGPPPPLSPSSGSASAGRGEPQEKPAYYYPPPPPGPPPKQAQAYMATGNEPPRDGYDSPPPSYAEEFGDGPVASGDADAKSPLPPPPPPPGPPTLPPRPTSSGMYFPPPPASPSKTPQGTGGGSWRIPNSGGGINGGDGGSTDSDHGLGDKLYRWSIKAGVPVNKIANKLGSEAFWPMTMDQECDKAASILRDFCKNGFFTTPSNHNKNPAQAKQKLPSSPTGKSKVLVKIPASVIAGARGLAIFTTLRTGLHISGAVGSGVVVARLPDGSWSPPAGFTVHTVAVGFMIGVDLYDCVCVLTTQAAVDAFAHRARLSIGGEITVTAGPVGVGGVVEGLVGGFSGKGKAVAAASADDAAAAAANAAAAAGGGHGSGGAGGEDRRPVGASSGCENKPVWSYVKSRGFYAGVQADGTVIVPRVDANVAFYGESGITVERILKGQVRSHPAPTRPTGDAGKEKTKDGELVMWPEGGRKLAEFLKVAEGKADDADFLRRFGDHPKPSYLDGFKLHGN